jgi:hypothetical protein
MSYSISVQPAFLSEPQQPQLMADIKMVQIISTEQAVTANVTIDIRQHPRFFCTYASAII